MDLDDLALQCAISDFEFAQFYRAISESELRETALALLDEPIDEDFDLIKIKSIAEFPKTLSEKQKYCLAKYVWSFS
jgi:hypothetical protein